MRLLPTTLRLGVFTFAAALGGMVTAALPSSDGAGDKSGATVYLQKCARCHGKAGEGAADHPHPLAGNRSLTQLARYLAKSMPEDAPGTLSAADAEKVAAYIFDAFYSPAAQAKIKAPKLERSRLTDNEYRNAMADAVGTIPAGPRSGDRAPAGAGPDAQGLRGEYFTTGGKRNKTLALARVDPVVQIDFIATPDLEMLKTGEISATWQGSVVAPETGLYEFIVRTEHSTRLWVNDLKLPLIDRAVKSGNDTEFRGSIFLLGGRAYPLRLEFSRTSLGVRKEAKEKPTPVKTSIALAWKPPHRTDEIIPARHLRPDDAGTAFVPTVALPADDRSAGYERGTAVSKEWVQATTDGALEAAGYVTTRLTELSGIKADAANRKDKLQDYCLKFAERAFRRPLTAEQKKLFVDRQFEIAKDPETAVKRVVLLVLQSPRFLYREPPTGGDALDVAARLSFMLWDSPPDQQLLKAAVSDKLKTREDVTREAQRMLADRRAHAKLRLFLMQWLKLDQGVELARDAKLFPGFDGAAASDLRTSLELFLNETLWSERSDYRQFLLADHVYLNGRLSKLYGGDLPEDAPFQKVLLKSSERSGVLTHPYLLANYSYPKTSSPIHRGVFLARNVLGVALRPPPDAFTPLAPELHPKLNTRERITLQTSQKQCLSCHGVINPLGFTLERFDAIGRFRDEDNGKPIDATGSFVTRSGDKVSFKGVQDLAKFLAESEEAHEAFTARLFHFLVKQPILAYGPDNLGELRRFFADNDYHVRRLVVEIVMRSALVEREKLPGSSDVPKRQN